MKGRIHTIVLISSLSGLVVTSSSLNSEPQSEQYYSPDIDSAIEDARRHPVSDQYIGNSWYNRSTSKSFALPRLLNTEMDEEIIEGAMGATAAGEESIIIEPGQQNADLGRTLNEKSLEEKRPLQETSAQVERVPLPKGIYIREIQYEGQGIESSVRDIRANSTIEAYRSR